MYDSAADTQEHIGKVQNRMADVVQRLARRALVHDASKLASPEKEAFDEMTPLLRDTTYGSDEYNAGISRLGPALAHHYAVNSHHPEHYPDGIAGMSLLDILEMVCDWAAASERHADGDIMHSIEVNRKRFGISEQLVSILKNTCMEMGW